MLRTVVRSTSVRSIGYDAVRQVLEVEFRRRGTYQYLNVPPETYEALMRSEGKGEYLNAHIRDVYRAVQLEHP